MDFRVTNNGTIKQIRKVCSSNSRLKIETFRITSQFTDTRFHFRFAVDWYKKEYDDFELMTREYFDNHVDALLYHRYIERKYHLIRDKQTRPAMYKNYGR